MRFNFPKLGRLYFPLVAVVVLLASFGGYYFFYVRHQEEYYTRRNLRELAVMSKQLHDQIETYRRVLKNRANHIWFSSGILSTYVHSKSDLLDAILGFSGDVVLRPSELRCLQDRRGILTNSDGVRRVTEECLVKRYVDDRVPDLTYVAPDEAPHSHEGISLVLRNGTFWLYLSVESEEALPFGDENKIRIHARAKLDEIGRKLVSESEFDSVLFVDTTGRVLFRSEHSELRATAVHQLVEEGRHTVTGVMEDEFGGTSYKVFIQPLRLPLTIGEDPEQSGGDESGGTREANSPSAPAPSQGSEWIICGLVEAARFESEALAISYSVIIWFAFLLLMTVLLWPFLKLALLAPAERLHRLEGFKLLLATLMGSAAITLCATDLYYFTRLKWQLDERLEDVASMIDAHVGEEIDKILTQLQSYEKARALRPCEGDRLGSMLQKIDPKYTTDYPYLDMVFWANAKGQQTAKWSIEDAPTSTVSVAPRGYFIRVREQGDGIRELAVLRSPNEESGAAVRRFWLESIYSSTTGVNQAVVSTRTSKDSCQGAIMVAGVTRPLSLMEPVLPAGFGFAVVDRAGAVLFHSDLTRLLIENFVAEADGDRALKSAIEGGIEKALRVRYAGQDHQTYVRPLSRVEGLPWALIVFHNMRSLRTAANLEVLTSTSFLFLAYLGFLLLAIYMVFAAAWRSPLWFLRPDSSVSFWPDRKKRPVYRQFVVLNTSLIVFLGLWVVIGHGAQVAMAACLIPVYSCLLTQAAIRYGDRLCKGALLWKWSLPLLAVAALLWRLVMGPDSWPAAFVLCGGLVLASIPLASRRGWQRVAEWGSATSLKSYLIALTMAFVLVSVLPTIGFFKVAYVLERELMAERSQVRLARALEARSERVRARYASIKTERPTNEAAEADPAGISKSGFLERRLHTDRLDTYDGNALSRTGKSRLCDAWIPCVRFGVVALDADRSPEGSGTGQEKEPFEDPVRTLFRTIRPLYNEFAEETWTLLHEASLSPRREGDELKLRHQYLNDTGVEITSVLSDMVFPFQPLFGVGWLVFILGIYGGVRLIARKVFLIDIPVPSPRRAQLDSEQMVHRNLFILGHPFSKKSDLLKSRQDVHVLDLADVARSDEMPDPASLPADKIIGVDQFEYEIDNPPWNRKKLELLEELVYSRRKREDVPNSSVLVVSSVDPVFYAATGGSGKVHEDVDSGDDLDRWAGVMSSFEVVDYAEQAKPGIDKILTDFSRKMAAVGDRPGGAPDVKTQNRLREILHSECSSTVALRHVATEIVDSLPQGASLRSKELTDLIFDRCEAYYRSLWASCSKAEKLMLVQLAEEGLVNRKNERVLRHLMRKGLIVRTPRLRLMNDTFQRFVLAVRGEEDVQQWEEEGGRQGWVLWRGVLVTVLVMLLAFLALTQREILESWIPILGAFAGGVAGLLRLLAMFKGGPGR